VRAIQQGQLTPWSQDYADTSVNEQQLIPCIHDATPCRAWRMAPRLHDTMMLSFAAPSRNGPTQSRKLHEAAQRSM